jgi:hypothetical protein
VHHGVAAPDRRAKQFGLEEIANDHFSLETFKVSQIAGGADEEPQLRAPLCEFTSYMRSDESGGSGEEDFHECGIPKRLFYGSDAVMNARIPGKE